MRQPHLLVAELAGQRRDTGDVADQVTHVEQAIAEKQEELKRYLRLYGRGNVAANRVEEMIREAEGHIAALEAYRRELEERRRQTDLWEESVASIVEALEALRTRIDGGLSWEEQRHCVELLVKGIIVETRTDIDGRRHPVAHITYSFRRPKADAPIPAELVPLFQQVAALSSTPGHAIQPLARAPGSQTPPRS